jgi:hypothetical protein
VRQKRAGLACGDARLASAKSGQAGWGGLHRIVSLYFLRPVWPALYIARSMPVFDLREALIFKGFLSPWRSGNPRFRNSRIAPSDHPDDIRVIPETLYLRAFPRFFGCPVPVPGVSRFQMNGLAPKRKNPRFRGFSRTE